MNQELKHHCSYAIAMECRRIHLTIEQERAMLVVFRKAAEDRLPPGPPSAPIPPRDKPVA